MSKGDPRESGGVTDDQIASYRRDGWVHLPAFLSPAETLALLALAQVRMGADGRGNAPSGTPQQFFNPEFGAGLDDRLLRPVIDRAASYAHRLMARRVDVGVRYFGDLFAVKLPADATSAHGGNGRTYFHQDFINWGLDRSGGMTFWIALEDYGADAGTMSFVSGSHRAGTLGNYRAFAECDVIEHYPELLDDCRVEPAVQYAAGDATVHSALTVHGADRNRTGHPRWAYAVIVNPGDARWNGAPAEAYDTSGMTVLQAFDEARFPRLA